MKYQSELALKDLKVKDWRKIFWKFQISGLIIGLLLKDDKRSGHPKTATTDENIANTHQMVYQFTKLN